MRFDTDRIVSLSALVVGIGSLFVVVYQTYLTRQQQFASVRPYLYLQLQSDDQSTYLLLSNSGTGPALIDEIRVGQKDRMITGDPYDFYTGLKPEAANTLAVDVDKILPGRLIPPGTTIRMLGVTGAHHRKMLEELLRLFAIAEVPQSWYAELGTSPVGKAVIEITFSSIYGQRWRIRSDRLVPERL
jgi:hypothetical protein